MGNLLDVNSASYRLGLGGYYTVMVLVLQYQMGNPNNN